MVLSQNNFIILGDIKNVGILNMFSGCALYTRKPLDYLLCWILIK